MSSGRKDRVSLAGCDCRERHAAEFRGLGVLNEHGPARGPDGLAAAGPVGPRAGEDHGDGPLSRVLREGGKKFVDGKMDEPLGVDGCLEEAVSQADLPARRGEVKSARLRP